MAQNIQPQGQQQDLWDSTPAVNAPQAPATNTNPNIPQNTQPQGQQQDLWDTAPNFNSQDQVQSPGTAFGDQVLDQAKSVGIGAVKGAANLYDMTLMPILTDSMLVPADASMSELANKYLPEPKNKVTAAATEGGVGGGLFGPVGAAVGAGANAGTEFLNEKRPDHPVENVLYPSILSMLVSPGLFRQGLRGLRLLGEGMGVVNRDPLVQARIDQDITAGTPASVNDSDFWSKMQRSFREILGSKLNKKQQQEGEQLAQAVNRQADTLGPDVTQQQAGTQLQTGITGGVRDAKNAFTREHQSLDHFVDPQTTEVDMTPFLADMYRKMSSPPGSAVPLIGNKSQVGNDIIQRLQDNITDYGRGTNLSLANIRDLKSQVGDKLEESLLNGDANKRQLQIAYGVLSDAQEQAYRNAAGGMFLPRFQQLKAAEAQMYNTIENFAQPLIRDGLTPEKIADRLSSEVKLGDTKLDKVFQVINDPNVRDMYSGYILRDLGLNRKGEFDPNRFFTNWQQMAPEAKQALFSDPATNDIPKAYDQLALIAQNQARGRAAVNPSQTAGTLHLFNQLNAWASLVGGAIGYGAGAFHGSGQDQTGLADSPWLKGAAGAGLGALAMKTGGEWAIAKMMQNPAFVRWLATPVPVSNIPDHIRALSAVAAEAPNIKNEVQNYQNYLQQQNSPPGRYMEGGIAEFPNASNRYSEGGTVQEPQGFMGGGVASSPFGIGDTGDNAIAYAQGGVANDDNRSLLGAILSGFKLPYAYYRSPFEKPTNFNVAPIQMSPPANQNSKISGFAEGGSVTLSANDNSLSKGASTPGVLKVPNPFKLDAEFISKIDRLDMPSNSNSKNYAEGGVANENEFTSPRGESNLVDLFMGIHGPLGGGGPGGPRSTKYIMETAPGKGVITKQTPSGSLEPSTIWTNNDPVVSKGTEMNENEPMSHTDWQDINDFTQGFLTPNSSHHDDPSYAHGGPVNKGDLYNPQLPGAYNTFADGGAVGDWRSDKDATLIAKYESGGRPFVGTGNNDLTKYVQSGNVNPNGFPNWPGIQTKYGLSTAAGLWQITKTNWDKYAPLVGVHDFSPESQYKVFQAMKADNGLTPWLGKTADGVPFNPKLLVAYNGSGGSNDKNTNTATSIQQQTLPNIINQIASQDSPDNGDEDNSSEDKRIKLAQEHVDEVPWADPETKRAIIDIWRNANV